MINKGVKIKLILASICTLLVLFIDAKAQQVKIGKPVVEPSKILDDVMHWLYYDRDYLRLSEDFIAYDQTLKPITKDRLLEKVASGGYLPLRLISDNGSIIYKLYKMPVSTKPDIKAVIKDYGATRYKYYQKEGKKLPHFNFVDLNGKKYNEASTKGKIVVFKFWFVACLPCIQEMPELNKLVANYKNRKDILFVSLALDDKKKLRDFLKKTRFDYAVVPDQESYISNILKINAYPTHLIINKKGLVAKVGEADLIFKELKKEAAL